MSRKLLKHVHTSDVRGLAQLATAATTGVVAIAEEVHLSVLKALGVPGGGLVSLVYQSVHASANLVGKSLDTLLARLQPALETSKGTPQREAAVAILNGVLGDRMEISHNPLVTPMTLRYRGEALDGENLPADFQSKGKVLLMIHGLCMNDLQWCSRHQGRMVDHGQALAAATGSVPLYLRYNSGRHISQNGRELSAQLEQLVKHWPEPVKEIILVNHSMGGLVARSAIHYGQQEGKSWTGRLKNLVFLGTPHHGAPLERAGNWVDYLLASSPFTAPFSKIGKMRSAGITDLRFGYLLEEDWQGRDRFLRQPESHQHLPLPEGVVCYTIAASLVAKPTTRAEELVGDGLVPLRSALGKHRDARFSLIFEQKAQRLFYSTSHLGLLSKPEVTLQLVDWLDSGEN